MPSLTTSPATPRKEAAERYSPETAAELSSGLTRREATRKSEVVRMAATPRNPMRSVTSTTGATAKARIIRSDLRFYGPGYGLGSPHPNPGAGPGPILSAGGGVRGLLILPVDYSRVVDCLVCTKTQLGRAERGTRGV